MATTKKEGASDCSMARWLYSVERDELMKTLRRYNLRFRKRPRSDRIFRNNIFELVCPLKASRKIPLVACGVTFFIRI
jgi:hypothetical protein